MDVTTATSRGAHQDGQRSRPLLAFFVLVVLLSLPFWLVGAFVETPAGTPMDVPVSALMFVCPSLAAVILLRRHGVQGAFRRLLKRVGEPIEPRIWYLPTVLTLPAIGILVYVALRLSGEATGDHSPFAAIPLLFVLFLVSAVGEEAGWMGYAVDLMQKRWAALTTAMLLGVFWAAWHVVPLIQAQRSPAWIAWWFLGTVATRVLIVWLYNNTGKAVLAAVVFHAVSNVVSSLLPDYGTRTAPVAFFAVFTALAAVVVTVLWGPGTLARLKARSSVGQVEYAVR